MRFSNIGSGRAQVSRVALGTMNFGPDTPMEDAHRILDEAIDLGITLIDTANVYGWSPRQGWTESIIGEWLLRRPGVRDRIVLATKVYEPMGSGPNDRGLSAVHLRAQIEASLRRLQTDRIDLYQFHHIDRAARWEEVWPAMDRAQLTGQVLYVGSSNFPAWKIAQGNERAQQRGGLGLVTEQSVYNLMQRDIEYEVLPAVREYGMGLIAYSPLAGGNLAGAAHRLTTTPRSAQSGRGVRQRFEAHRDRIQRFDDAAADFGTDPAQLALAWLLHQPAVTAAVVGARRPSQLQRIASASEMSLTAEQLASLENIWPGNQPAPEAYAW